MKRISRLLAVLALAATLLGLSDGAHAEGSAPVAENYEFKTERNTPFTASLSAQDVDGGELTFTITTEPVKGSIRLEPNGSFTYTPGTDKKGRDYFGYKAADSEGNLSQEATVIIKIEKSR